MSEGLKVGFIAPLSIAAVNGGVRNQVFRTAEGLQKLGVEIIFISPWEHFNAQDFDLIHLFSAGPETSNIANLVCKSGAKLIVSPVFFSNRSSSVIQKAIQAEKLTKFLGSGIRSDFSIKADICQLAERVLPNTTAELELIQNGFNIPFKKLSVIPNGVESRFSEATPELFIKEYGCSDFVLFVGQASASRKNVLGLLEAAPRINSKLVIIGGINDTDEYGKKCLALINQNSNIIHIPTLMHDSDLLASAYAACNTFVLPSMYETPGIAALEAGLAGANIAITERGGTKDYFMHFAEYLNPKSVENIANAVNTSLSKKKEYSLKKHILEHYTWDKVAEQTLIEYKKVLQ